MQRNYLNYNYYELINENINQFNILDDLLEFEKTQDESFTIENLDIGLYVVKSESGNNNQEKLSIRGLMFMYDEIHSFLYLFENRILEDLSKKQFLEISKIFEKIMFGLYKSLLKK